MQRFSLTAKLALVLSALSLILVLTTLLLIKTSFDKGFDRYINRSIAGRMEALADNLAATPETFGKLLESRRQWDRFLRQYYHDTAHEQDQNADDVKIKAGRDVDPWSGGRRYVWLFNAHGDPAFNSNLPHRELLKLLPVTVDDKVVGFIAWVPVKARDNAMDALFAKRQHRLFAWIALFSVIGSCILAWPLSRYLVNPVRRLSKAMRGLMRRDYQQRVPVESRDELGNLARDFNLMAQTLEEHDSQQRQWLADISHELRTPLGVLKGELEAIEDGVMSLDQSRVRSLSEEVNQLARLVDDLHQLAVTQMSHLRYRLEPLDLSGFMEQLSYRLIPMMQQAGLTWSFTAEKASTLVSADAQRLEQLIMNLAQNSIRYTSTGGQVNVSVRRREKIELLWEDSEPGMEPADIAHLFDRFYRVEHSRQRSLGGSGLGLFIVANIAEAHGAVPQAEASALGGLKITFRFDAQS